MPRYLMHADDEYLVVTTASIFNAFSLVRAIRPGATVVTDAYGDKPQGSVTHIEITERQAPAPVEEN
jgi:hypothetical protein